MCFLSLSLIGYAQVPQGIIIADSANGRNIPDLEASKVLFTVRFNNTVSIISTLSSAPAESRMEAFLLDTTYPWYQVETLSQKTGWIYGKYLAPVPEDSTMVVLNGGLYTNSIWKSDNFTNDNIKDFYLALPKWSYLVTYIPDKYDIIFYLYNGTTSTFTTLNVDVQIDEENGRLTNDSFPPPSTRWITNIRKYSKTIDSITTGEVQKIIIPNISFTEDIQKEQQLNPNNWIWGIRLQIHIPVESSKPYEKSIQVIPPTS